MARLTPHYPSKAHRKLFWIDGFLTPAQCALILEELEFAFWRPSTVSRRTPDGLRSFQSRQRVSESTDEEWFTPDLAKATRLIVRRLGTLVPGVSRRCEAWQATRYARGGKFAYHYDCGHWAHEPAGDRAYTILVYLDTPRRGGQTSFLNLGIEVKANAGRLLVWRNLDNDGKKDPDMLHAGAPLVEGRKSVLVNWVRERNTR